MSEKPKLKFPIAEPMTAAMKWRVLIADLLCIVFAVLGFLFGVSFLATGLAVYIYITGGLCVIMLLTERARSVLKVRKVYTSVIGSTWYNTIIDGFLFVVFAYTGHMALAFCAILIYAASEQRFKPGEYKKYLENNGISLEEANYDSDSNL